MDPTQKKAENNSINSSQQKNIINKNNNIQKKILVNQQNPNKINQKLPKNETPTIKAKKNVMSQVQKQQNNNINKNDGKMDSLIQTPQSLSININNSEFKDEKEEFERTQKYINYLKTHLDSSYYAFNEIKNKNSILLAKSKTLNDEIKKGSIIYQKLRKSIDEKTQENNSYKEKYEKILEQKKINNEKNGCWELDQKIEKMKEKNLILSKENKSKEEIISNLKKTLEILEKNKMEKNKEKKDRLKELNNEINSIEKLKLEYNEMGKELYGKNKELEETKKSILNLISQSNINLIEKGEPDNNFGNSENKEIK